MCVYYIIIGVYIHALKKKTKKNIYQNDICMETMQISRTLALPKERLGPLCRHQGWCRGSPAMFFECGLEMQRRWVLGVGLTGAPGLPKTITVVYSDYIYSYYVVMVAMLMICSCYCYIVIILGDYIVVLEYIKWGLYS